MENSGLFHDKLDTLHLRVSLYTILKLTNTPTHRLPPFFKVGQEVHHVHPLKAGDLVGKGPSSSLSLLIRPLKGVESSTFPFLLHLASGLRYPLGPNGVGTTP